MQPIGRHTWLGDGCPHHSPVFPLPGAGHLQKQRHHQVPENYPALKMIQFCAQVPQPPGQRAWGGVRDGVHPGGLQAAARREGEVQRPHGDQPGQAAEIDQD